MKGRIMKFAIFASAFALALAASGASAQTADEKEAAVKAGETVFAQCRACHQVGPTAKNTVGPKLNGLMGRKSGEVEGYNYSDANKNSGITWDDASFAEYIANPREKMPGTKMAYAGLKDPKRIENLIAYLKQFDKDGAIQK
jgi:cytochrome c